MGIPVHVASGKSETISLILIRSLNLFMFKLQIKLKIKIINIQGTVCGISSDPLFI